MKTETQDTVDGLADLVLMIKGDQNLCQWFWALAKRSVPDRAVAILQATQRLASEGADVVFLKSLQMLTDPRVFEAAEVALEHPQRAGKRLWRWFGMAAV